MQLIHTKVMQTPFNMIFKVFIFILSLNSIIGTNSINYPFKNPNEFGNDLGDLDGCSLDLKDLTKCSQGLASELTSSDKKTLCCAGWDLYDCIEGIKKDCNFNEMKESIEKNCKDEYPHGSVKCHFPWWGILLIVLGSLLIVGIIGFFVLRHFKNKK